MQTHLVDSLSLPPNNMALTTQCAARSLPWAGSDSLLVARAQRMLGGHA